MNFNEIKINIPKDFEEFGKKVYSRFDYSLTKIEEIEVKPDFFVISEDTDKYNRLSINISGYYIYGNNSETDKKILDYFKKKYDFIIKLKLDSGFKKDDIIEYKELENLELELKNKPNIYLGRIIFFNNEIMSLTRGIMEKGTGKILLEILSHQLKDDDFIIIRALNPEALDFYLSVGFKWNDGNLFVKCKDLKENLYKYVKYVKNTKVDGYNRKKSKSKRKKSLNKRRKKSKRKKSNKF